MSFNRLSINNAISYLCSCLISYILFLRSYSTAFLNCMQCCIMKQKSLAIVSVVMKSFRRFKFWVFGVRKDEESSYVCWPLRKTQSLTTYNRQKVLPMRSRRTILGLKPTVDFLSQFLRTQGIYFPTWSKTAAYPASIQVYSSKGSWMILCAAELGENAVPSFELPSSMLTSTANVTITNAESTPMKYIDYFFKCFWSKAIAVLLPLGSIKYYVSIAVDMSKACPAKKTSALSICSLSLSLIRPVLSSFLLPICSTLPTNVYTQQKKYAKGCSTTYSQESP
ncbi:hypothetical protein FGO68_gene2246 [Halteria grandinella]|uniref:Uncharacterized protein n=1 Tax=Halteria grandinella TaxID=5974 RepID=A0A8J8P5G1_HALGN|nr:hypothetical protein FGO68_gene2246 [Halteria grandinella]